MMNFLLPGFDVTHEVRWKNVATVTPAGQKHRHVEIRPAGDENQKM